MVKKPHRLSNCGAQTTFAEDVCGGGGGGVETVCATINNVLQSNYRVIGWVGDTGRVFGGAKRHASLHSLKPGFKEELRLCSVCLRNENDSM